MICPSRASQLQTLAGSETHEHENSLHAAGILVLFESFLGILLLGPDISTIILFRMFVHVFDTLKIPVHRLKPRAVDFYYSQKVRVIHFIYSQKVIC